MSFLREVINRWSEERPKFFNTLNQLGAWLFGAGFALVGVPAAFEAIVPNANIDLTLLVQIASYFVLAGLCISAVSNMTAKNPDYTTLDKKKVSDQPKETE